MLPIAASMAGKSRSKVSASKECPDNLTQTITQLFIHNKPGAGAKTLALAGNAINSN